MTLLEFLNANKSEIIGIVAFLTVVAGGVLNHFRVKSQPNRPLAAEFHLDGQASFTDMAPVKALTSAVERLTGAAEPLPVQPGRKAPVALPDLMDQISLLTMQHMKSSVSSEATATSMRELVDLMAAYLADLRAERAEREEDERVEERAQALARDLAAKMMVQIKPTRARRPSNRPSS